MELKWAENQGFYLAEVSGNIDSNSAPALLKKIEEKIETEPDNIVIDFSNVDYISSAGLRVVIKTNHLLAASSKKVMLCGLKDYVRDVFDMAGLGKILDIRESLQSITEEKNS